MHVYNTTRTHALCTQAEPPPPPDCPSPPPEVAKAGRQAGRQASRYNFFCRAAQNPSCDNVSGFNLKNKILLLARTGLTERVVANKMIFCFCTNDLAFGLVLKRKVETHIWLHKVFLH